MTSFKSAQLIAKANDADKVVFLLDRIELSTQSADEYRGFANADDNVLETDDTRNLLRVLESDSKDDSLIVTSIQKMSRINTDNSILRNNRNTSDGNGAHASYLLTEKQLDYNINAFVTLYLYVTGCLLPDLKTRYDI